MCAIIVIATDSDKVVIVTQAFVRGRAFKMPEYKKKKLIKKKQNKASGRIRLEKPE